MIKTRLSRGFNLTRDSQTQIGKSQQILVDGESARLEAAHLENGNILSASSALNALRPFSDGGWAEWIALANLAKGLGRALRWESHGRPLDIGIKKQSRSTHVKDEKTHWLPRIVFAKALRGLSVELKIEEEISLPLSASTMP